MIEITAQHTLLIGIVLALSGRRGLPVKSATRIYVSAALYRGRTVQRLAVARLHASAVTG